MYKKLILLVIFSLKLQAIPHYYATSADSKFFEMVVRLIGTINTNDRTNLVQIAVFDLGFTKQQRNYLNKLKNVRVYNLELTKNKDLLTYFTTSPQGRKVRGWFAWKPVALKQALDLFPYVLYLDAGMEVLNSLDLLFLHIAQNGYYLIDSGHTLSYRITKPVVDKIIKYLPMLDQEIIYNVNTKGVSAGIQGLSREYYHSYLQSVYNWTGDLTVFADDGTCQLGFGEARHDQTIFSIYAILNGMYINQAGWQKLIVDGQPATIHCHWNRAELVPESVIKY